MYRITQKVELNPTVTKLSIEAPLIAQKAQPGQFIIVRPLEGRSERIPLTIAGYDRQAGTVDIIFQIVGRHHHGAERPEGGRRKSMTLWAPWAAPPRPKV